MTNHSLYASREAAANEQDKYRAQVERVRSNRDLSDEGRSRQLGRIYAETRGKLDELRKREQEQLTSRWNTLEVDLFGMPKMLGGDPARLAISARDASDRAEQITTAAEAASLLRRAEADRDELLARAVARRCMERADQEPMRQSAEPWESVFGEFAGKRPQLDGVIEELAEIEDMHKPQVFGPYSLPRPAGVTDAMVNNPQTDDSSTVAGV